jgi:hypothetical protein
MIFLKKKIKIEPVFEKNEISISVDTESLKDASFDLGKIVTLYIAAPNKEVKKICNVITKVFSQGGRSKLLANKLIGEFHLNQDQAKKLASHSLNFLSAKYREKRFLSIGIEKYKWSQSHKGCHDFLDNKVFSFRYPPISSEEGWRANPGELANCTCIAAPEIE